MISRGFGSRFGWFAVPAVLLALVAPGGAQAQRGGGRRGKPLAPAAKITVTVEKAANGKRISNAAVVFHAWRDGKDTGSLEVKTNPDGEASIDVIEVGSHVRVQVIADGFATNATEFDVPGDEKAVLVKMEMPRAQVSAYQDNDGKASQRPVGVQEPRPISKPKKPGAMSSPSPVASPAVPPLSPPASPETVVPAPAAEPVPTASASPSSTPK